MDSIIGQAAERAQQGKAYGRGNQVDAELEALLQQHNATIKVVGCGGGGNNTINRITEVGIAGAETIAVNTDAQDLLYCTSDVKILIGKELTKGLGAGSKPQIGEDAAKESEQDIRDALQGADLVFVTAGLGGGTGSGAASVVAAQAKRIGALVIGIVTTPFAMEGQRRQDNAQYGLEKLEEHADTLIIIPNDKLLELAPNLPLHTAFKVADEILTNSVKGIAEMITGTGLVNLDFADIRTVMKEGGVALIGVGESDSQDRAHEAVEKAIANPLLDADVSGASGALVNITGSSDMTLEECRTIAETVSSRLHDDAHFIWGSQISEDLGKTIRVMLIVTGVQSAQIGGRTKNVLSESDKKELRSDLGIEFMDE